MATSYDADPSVFHSSSLTMGDRNGSIVGKRGGELPQHVHRSVYQAVQNVMHQKHNNHHHSATRSCNNHQPQLQEETHKCTQLKIDGLCTLVSQESIAYIVQQGLFLLANSKNHNHSQVDTLILSHLHLGNAPHVTLQPLLDYLTSSHCTLCSLQLAGNRLGDVSTRHVLQAITTNTTLRQLDLSTNYLETDRVGEALEQCLLFHPTLQDLNLSFNWFHASAVEALARGLLASTTLQHLNLAGGLLGNESAQYLWPALGHIHSLNLSANHLTYDGSLAGLSGLLETGHVQELILSNNTGLFHPAGDSVEEHEQDPRDPQDVNTKEQQCYQAVEHFASALARNTSLTSLTLANTGLRSETVLLLFDALTQNIRLTTLDVTDNVLRQGYFSTSTESRPRFTLEATLPHWKGLRHLRWHVRHWPEDGWRALHANTSLVSLGPWATDARLTHILERNRTYQYVQNNLSKNLSLFTWQALLPRVLARSKEAAYLILRHGLLEQVSQQNTKKEVPLSQTTPTERKEDWVTTCLIYNTEEEEVEDSVKHFRTDYQTLDTRSKDFVNFCLVHLGETSPVKWQPFEFISVASIQLPVSATQTAIFGQRETKDPDFYRFWMLDQQSKPRDKPVFSLRIKLLFLYATARDQDESLDLEGPIDVLVSVTSPYPDTWPSEDQKPWSDWLQAQARDILKEHQTSYAVCEFLDHHALDYFSTIQMEEEGYVLILFPSTCMYWQGKGVDSLVLKPIIKRNEPRTMMLHQCNAPAMEVSPAELWPTQGRGSSYNEGWLHPCVLLHKKWLPQECPICFDEYVATDMVELDCRHLVCEACFSSYASIQVSDIGKYRRENPFKCPMEDCRQGIKIIGIVKPYLTETEMKKVRAWYKDLNQPISRLLPTCLDCSKEGKTQPMRKKAIDSFCVICEKCGKQRCEYCLAKVKNDNKEHLSTTCKGAQTLKFARRYWRASPELQQKCEAQYPWIKAYAQARVGSELAIRDWLAKREGQLCPTCSNGVVRTSGCFHIHCSCGCHFCYECGSELFPPFYGTHHCWERSNDGI